MSPWPDRPVSFGGCTVEDLAFLAQQLPGAYQQLMDNEASCRRLEWADLIAQITGHICGLAALLILALVSWHAIDRGAFIQGASIICTGAVSIVALFVTGKATSRNPAGARCHNLAVTSKQVPLADRSGGVHSSPASAAPPRSRKK